MLDREILSLFEKYLKKNITEDELTTLNKLLENSENAKGFKDMVKDDYLLNTKNVDFNAKESFKKIESRLEKVASKKVIQLKSFYKYAAAAVLVFGLGYFYKQSSFDTPNETSPIIVKTNIIEPGTDKATLTLSDGSQVTLEKGDSFQTQNANSNGEEIVYVAKERNSSELVYNYLTIPTGGQFFVKLSDGTQVWLNSETQLKYPVSFIEGETRQVELVYGEAYFDVSPSVENQGSKFKVINNAQNVEVLGTEFNIKAYKDEASIYTTLVEGKVVVNALNTSKVLNPNDELNFNHSTNSLLVSSGVDVYKVISWKEGVFSFRDKPLKDIMKVLSRWYDIKVDFKSEETKMQTFHGSLDKKLSIEEIISIICTTNTIEYEINESTVLLK